MNRLLLETDTPYLAPGIHKGQLNKPEFIVETAKELASLKAITLNELSELTIKNTNTILGK
jgi:TatD DNase family protein